MTDITSRPILSSVYGLTKPKTDLQRIADALERIAAALEKR